MPSCGPSAGVPCIAKILQRYMKALNELDADALETQMKRLNDVFDKNPEASLSGVKDQVIQQFSQMLGTLRSAHQRKGLPSKKAIVFVLGAMSQDYASFKLARREVDRVDGRGGSIEFFEASPKSLQYIVEDAAEGEDDEGYYDELYLSCNKSIMNQIKNVVVKICHMEPSSHEPYIQKLTQGVLTLLLLGTEVTMFGFSYGGSAALRVAENLADGQKDTRVDLSKLTVITAGSIHVPRPVNAWPMKVVNILDARDVASLCHHLKPPKFNDKQWLLRDDARGITWLNTDPNQKRAGLQQHNYVYVEYVTRPLFWGGPTWLDAKFARRQKLAESEYKRPKKRRETNSEVF